MQSHAHIALNAHLLSGASSYRSAGIHGYLHHTLTRLSAFDSAFTYSALVGQGQVDESQRLRVIRSRWPTQSPMARILWEQVAMPFVLRSIQPELLHGMGFSLPVMWNGPSVVTIYDLSFIRYPERLTPTRRLYLNAITRQSVRRATRTLAISESGKSEIQELLDVPASRIDVARPGVDERFRPLPDSEVEAFRVEQQLPQRFILHVGTLEPRKNLATLLEAYARMPQRSEVKLTLAGGLGWQYEPLLALIETLDLQQDVILPGYVSNDILPLWYNAAEIFVYPSVYEGFGLPVLEAMACGAPVIAANASSLPEALGPDGMLMPPDDIEGWASAMAALLEDRDLQAAQRRRGIAQASRFTWEQTAQQHVESYCKALL